jgi:hypothetical protein
MHYHLRPGGVTTVIREQLRALSRQCDCMILTGELPPAGAPAGEKPDLAATVRIVPGLGYDEPGCGSPDPRGTAAAVRAAMIDEWGAPADVLHVHNPLLGKSSSLMEVLSILQEVGIALFLQVHDLAEDGRPSTYNLRGEYPRDCHYGVVNSRDQRALLASGLAPEGLHLLFNVVRPIGEGSIGACSLGSPLSPRPGSSRVRLLYPVRGIRRKNLGEALLLGVLVDADVSVTLPPQNPADCLRYSEWKSFARSQGMRAAFDVGLACGLADLMAESNAAVTTSVKEGFGFSFLEPWTARRAAVGRRIDAVCGDFEEEGIRLPHLYSSLAVPVALFDAPAFRGRWEASLTAAFESFGRTVDGASAQRACSSMTREGLIDFGSLDENAQREVIDRAAGGDAAARREIEAVNPGLDAIRAGLASPDASLAEGNRAVILSRFGSAHYAELLAGIYRTILENPVRQSIDRGALLDCYLSPGRFRILEQR